MNLAIRENIYRLYIKVTWTTPLESLGSKMGFYLEHFLELRLALLLVPFVTTQTLTYCDKVLKHKQDLGGIKRGYPLSSQ
jgi:hypothetical protein